MPVLHTSLSQVIGILVSIDRSGVIPGEETKEDDEANLEEEKDGDVKGQAPGVDHLVTATRIASDVTGNSFPKFYS